MFYLHSHWIMHQKHGLRAWRSTVPVTAPLTHTNKFYTLHTLNTKVQSAGYIHKMCSDISKHWLSNTFSHRPLNRHNYAAESRWLVELIPQTSCGGVYSIRAFVLKQPGSVKPTRFSQGAKISIFLFMLTLEDNPDADIIKGEVYSTFTFVHKLKERIVSRAWVI